MSTGITFTDWLAEKMRDPTWAALYRAECRKATPGSRDAVLLGCTCPHDQPQAFRGQYWQVETCPVHGYDLSLPDGE
jgi:hypothetical protein